MKIMDLARLIYSKRGTDETVDFAGGTPEEVSRYGGWCGIKTCNPFENDNDMYIIGHYGGEACTQLYSISEYDPVIGKFYEERIRNSDYKVNVMEQAEQVEIECIAKILVSFYEHFEGYIPSEVTTSIEFERYEEKLRNGDI